MSAIAGVTPIVRIWAARPCSQERIGTLTTIRSCLASHASSYQEIAATTSSSALSSALRADALIRFGSADHQ